VKTYFKEMVVDSEMIQYFVPQPIDNGAPRNEDESQNDKERGDRGGGAVVETNDARRLAKVLTLRLSDISTRG